MLRLSHSLPRNLSRSVQESIFKLFRESETEPSHLVVKNHLNQIFGLDTVALHRKDIRDVMAQVTDVVDLSEGRALRRASSLTRAGPRMAGNTCVEGCTAMCGVACLWRRYFFPSFFPFAPRPVSPLFRLSLLVSSSGTLHITHSHARGVSSPSLIVRGSVVRYLRRSTRAGTEPRISVHLRRYPPVSVPISTVYKATLLPLDASTGQEDTRASTVEVTAREKQTFFSLSLACKTCQFHNFEVQESDASEFSVA